MTLISLGALLVVLFGLYFYFTKPDVVDEEEKEVVEHESSAEHQDAMAEIHEKVVHMREQQKEEDIVESEN